MARGMQNKLAPPEPKRDENGRFVPGYSGNPRGRIPGTVYLKEALASLMGHTEEELKEVLNDETQPAVYRIAAARLVIACNYNDKRSDVAFDQVADRTEGKPAASHVLQVHQMSDPQKLLEEIEDEMRQVEGDSDQERLPVESHEESESGSD